MSVHTTRPLTEWRQIGSYRWRFEFKAVDAWVGAFWTQHDAWVCLLPCLPLHVRYIRGRCEHKGCKVDGEPCYHDPYTEEPSLYLCDEHAPEHYFCRHCREFYGGIESSHFIHPGLCEGCAMMGDRREWELFEEDEEELP